MRVPGLFSILLQIFLAGFDKNSQSDSVKTKTASNEKPQHSPFGKEEPGHIYESVWFEIHQRSKDGNGEWYCTPSYRRIAEKDVPAKLAEWKKFNQATTFDVGGLTLQFIDKRKNVYELRVIKRESVCTVISAEVFASR